MTSGSSSVESLPSGVRAFSRSHSKHGPRFLCKANRPVHNEGTAVTNCGRKVRGSLSNGCDRCCRVCVGTNSLAGHSSTNMQIIVVAMHAEFPCCRLNINPIHPNHDVVVDVGGRRIGPIDPHATCSCAGVNSTGRVDRVVVNRRRDETEGRGHLRVTYWPQGASYACPLVAITRKPRNGKLFRSCPVLGAACSCRKLHPVRRSKGLRHWSPEPC